MRLAGSNVLLLQRRLMTMTLAVWLLLAQTLMLLNLGRVAVWNLERSRPASVCSQTTKTAGAHARSHPLDKLSSWLASLSSEDGAQHAHNAHKALCALCIPWVAPLTWAVFTPPQGSVYSAKPSGAMGQVLCALSAWPSLPARGPPVVIYN